MTRWLARIPVVVAAVAVVAAVMATDAGTFTPDTQPDVYLAPLRALLGDLSAWRPDPYLGQPNLDVGLIPIELATLALSALGSPPWLATRIVRLALLATAAFGAATLLRSLGAGRPARAAAAIVYVVNPFVIVSAATLPILQPYALLPWLAVALLAAVRSPRSWTGPAAIALLFAAMGGQNAGVTPAFTLLAFPAVLGAAVVSRLLRLRDAAVITLRSAVLVIGVSLYWLVPALLAADAGATIAGGTESLQAITATSSWHEALRLLGNWPLYGRAGDRLFLPNAAAFVTSPLHVMATFLLPVAAAVGALLGRLRLATRVGLALVAVALPIVVSAHPPGAAAPFGQGMVWLFENVPGAIAFRTTVKAGSVVTLGVVVLIAVLADAATERLQHNQALGVLVVQAATVVLVLATIPMWTGDLYRRAYEVPDYWADANRDLAAAGGEDQRVWWLPGEHESVYRWGLRGPGSLAPAVSERPVVTRTSVPNGSVFQSNLLAAIDTTINAEQVTPGFLSTAAGYLGVSEVLARNDTAWEVAGAASPSTIDEFLVADPALRRAGDFGPPGRNTTAQPEAATTTADGALPPLRVYEVDDPRPIVWSTTVAGSVLLDGDAHALPQLHRHGLLEGGPAYRYLGGMDVTTAQAAIDSGARLVLTDTNRRRQVQTQRVDANWSPVLEADTPLVADGRTSLSLFTPQQQTVAVTAGELDVTATRSGPAFRLTASAHPHLAFDQDPTTAWRVGGLASPVGEALVLELRDPAPVDQLTIRPDLDGALQIARVLVSTDTGEEVGVALPPGQQEVPVRLNGAEVGRIEIRITALRGDGTNLVGLREVAVEAITAERYLRTPLTTAELVADGLEVPRTTPVDILLERATVGGAAEEVRLDRVVPVGVPRDFEGDVVARLHPTATDDQIDRLFGHRGQPRATSSSRGDGGAYGLRASAAVDGRPDTAWVPRSDGVGAWLELQFEPKVISELVIEQLAGASAPGADAISRVRITIDDTTSYDRTIGPGRTTVPIPGGLARRVRITITDVSGFGGRVGLREVGIDDVRIPPPAPGDELAGCHDLLTVDGEQMAVELSGSVADAVAGAPLPGRLCEELELAAGDRRLRAVDGILIDTVHLRSDGPLATSPTTRAADGIERTASEVVATVTTDDRRSLIVAGEGWDPRWSASLDGRDLGPPELVNGHAVGWVVEEAGRHRFVARYEPQRWLEVAGLVSLLTLVGLGAVLVVARQRRTVTGGRVTAAVDLRSAPPEHPGRVVGAAIAVAGGWLLDGPFGLAVGVIIAAGILLPVPRRLLRLAGTVVLAAVPVAVLVSGVPDAATLSPSFVLEARAAHHLAFAGIALVIAGAPWRSRT